MRRNLLLLLCLFVATFAFAQSFNPHQILKEAKEKAAAVRAARLDALRQLGETIKGVRLSSKTVVKDFVTESDSINAQFEGFLRGAQQEGKPKIYDDGTVELTMVIYVNDVIQGLKKIARENTSSVAPQKFNRMRRQGRKFKAVGTGAMKIKPTLPANVDIWRYVSIRGKLMAKRAAQIDVYRSLGETIYGVQLSTGTSVKDFVAQSDYIRAGFNRVVRGVQIDYRAVYRPEGVVEINGSLNVNYLLQFLSQMSRFDGRNLVNRESLQQIRSYFPNGIIRATGVGAPPARYILNSPRYPSIAKESKYDRVDGDYKPKPPVIDPGVDPNDPGTNDPVIDPNDPGTNDPVIDPNDPGTNDPVIDPVKPVDPVTPVEPVTPKPVVPVTPGFPSPPAPPSISINPPPRPQLPPLPKIPERFVPKWAQRYIHATGSGAYPENMPVGQALSMARRAAQVEAYRQLVENAIGVRLDSQTTVKDFISQRDEISARVNDTFLRGATTVKDRDLREERAFEVDMKLYLGDMWEIIDAEYNKIAIGKYGKQLKECQPDKGKYQGQFTQYENKLGAYKDKYQTYQQQLQTYHNSYGRKLSQAQQRQLMDRYLKYKAQTQQYYQKHQQYAQKLSQYRGEVDRYMREYSQYYAEYMKRYNMYKNEADAALTPGPPMPPAISFSMRALMGKIPAPPKIPQRFIPKWAQRHIKATGHGSYPRNMPVGQARAMARRAAQVDAYRLLAETALGVRLDSKTTVKDFLAQNDQISAKVNNVFLRGAQTVGDTDVRNEGYFKVHMKLFLGDMWEIIDAEYNKVLIEKYGKKLEDYQPDQRRYNSELEMYKGQLQTYRKKFLAYVKQLDGYYTRNGSRLALNYAVPKRYNALYKQYRDKAQEYPEKYRKYSQAIDKYQRELQRRKALYKKHYEQYQRTYNSYKNEADAALTPAPPAPPGLSFSIPKIGQLPDPPKVPQRFIPKWAKRDVTATGTGAYPKNMQVGQARAMARRAAQVDAYRLLVESALGVRLQSDTTVKDFLTQRDTIKARVNDAFLRGAQTIGAKDVRNDGYFEVKMKLFLGDMWEIIDAEYNKVLMKDYGKKLENYQPDQIRYRTELDLYKIQLRTYKSRFLSYQKQLQDYYAQNNRRLQFNYPLTKKYQAQYQKYNAQSQQFASKYRQYQEALAKYQRELQKRQNQQQQSQQQYQQLYTSYANEAKIALTPAPPKPPKLNFAGPKVQGMPSLPNPPERFIPKWAKRDITATGTGSYPKNMPVGQARAMARRAAQVDAYRLLVENALGVHLKSETSVKNFLTQKDTITARVKESFLRGAQTVGGRDVRQDRYFEVDMKLNLGDMWEIIDAEYNKVLMQKYGKKLEEYQPDQLRFRTELQIYQAQLRTYKQKYQAYLRQLNEYEQRYSSRLSADYPVARKYAKELQTYKAQTQQYATNYRKYQNQVVSYQKKKQQQIDNHAQFKQKYQQRYQAYQSEAAAALIPAPPKPPALEFDGPEGKDYSLPQPPARFVPKWAKRYITATGTGSYPPNRPAAQAKLLAKRAAQVDAYRLLVENALGVRLKSQTAVKNFLTQKDRMTARVNNLFLRGAQVVAFRNNPTDRYCEVDMKLYLGDMWKIIDAEYNKVLMKEYGKKLEQFQPDQARYRTELELYQARLRTYKNQYQAYQQNLREYQNKYGQHLRKNYSVTNKYRALYQKYENQSQIYSQKYRKYQNDIRKYEEKKQQEKVQYQRYKNQYQRQYQDYAAEAAANDR